MSGPTWNELSVVEKEEPKAPVETQAEEEVQFEGYENPPVPYNEEDIDEKFRNWIPDYHDQLIPRRKGFLSDFVYHTRGIMTPTLACIWSGLFLLQSVIKREAWIKWHPKPLYPNQYMIIIGPAGKVKKTTAVNDTGLPILRKFRNYIRDRNLYEMKQLTIIKDKSTPEAMITAMLPENKDGGDYYLQNPDGSFMHDDLGKSIRYTRTSEATIIVSELAVMLSKRSYADSMIENLLDLYDPHDDWEWRREGQGVKRLRHVCTCLIGGTTVDGFRSSIPHAARGDGFLSRTVLVYVPATKRVYPMPFLPRGAPDTEEMAKRLAWVSENTLGEYKLTQEALTLYEKWYSIFNRKMEDDPSLAGAISRMDINVLKTALLLRASRYDGNPGEIDEIDVEDAIRLVETTYQAVPYLLGQLDDDLVLALTAKAEVYLSKKKRVGRTNFIGALKIRSDIASIVIGELIARGEVYVECGGKKGFAVNGRSDEEYVWIEQDGTRAGAFEEIWHGSCFEDSISVRLDPQGGKSARSKPHCVTAMSAGERNKVLGSIAKTRAQCSKGPKRRTNKVDKGASGSDASTKPSGDHGDDRVLERPSHDVPVQAEEEGPGHGEGASGPAEGQGDGQD